VSQFLEKQPDCLANPFEMFVSIHGDLRNAERALMQGEDQCEPPPCLPDNGEPIHNQMDLLFGFDEDIIEV